VGEVDYVVNLLPNTPNTHDIYDAALFKQFKPTGLFINVGRGVAVVDADLVEALKEGHLAGAVIDVCRQEPLPQRHPFWTAWGLLLTGHSSAPTSPSLMVQLFVENLRAYQAGSVARGSGFQPRLLTTAALAAPAWVIPVAAARLFALLRG
jgi:phosphoglycerate dehydrogenase-like enzyme